MKNTIENTQEILNSSISGFHQYKLSSPAHLSFVSENLCAMTGFSEKELLSDREDLYASKVYPADKEQYSLFIHKLSQKAQTLTLQYRIVKKDGGILYVSDTMTSKIAADGAMTGNSVLTDITDIKAENGNLQFLNSTIPCGFLKYTCEKLPKITYINDQMLRILRFPEVREGELDYLELYKDNIFLMIPMEQRRRFALYLNRVYSEGAPIAGDLTVLRCDGTKAYLFGWVTKCVNEDGVEEFQSACMDITERHHLKREKENKRYIKALTDIYDKIFEYDLSAGTVSCLYGKNSAMFRNLENIPMQMEEATEKWITGTVCDDDRDRVRAFFNDFYNRRLLKSDSKPPQIHYRALSSDGELKTYNGIFIKTDDEVCLFCCRNVPDYRETDILRNENEALKNMQELVMRFTEGVVAFEIENGTVKPLYTSDNVCNFFGYTPEEWLALAEKNLSIKEFISQSGIAYEQIEELFATGESVFTYFDMTQSTYRKIRAICSQKSSDGNSHCYVMLYNLDDEGKKEDEDNENRVSIRTFGYFDVFVGDKPIAFRSQKSKELFALLVDRRGGYVSSEEAISFLWEEEPVNSVTLARYRKVALRLKNTLTEYGISEVVESVDGKRRIVTEMVQCDLYDYLSGKEEFSQLFKGSYLTNYSWGENTLAELSGNMMY